MKGTSKLMLLIAAAVVGTLPLLSQSSRVPRLSFEVVSIKPSAPQGVPGGGARGNRVTIVASTLRMLLQRAYQPISTSAVAPLQIIGGPDWIDSVRYDIQATANCSGGLSSEQVQLMVRSMLEDRFQLKAHKETREGEAYNLVVAKNPPKIKLSEDQTPVVRQATPPLQPCSPAPEASVNSAPPPSPAGQRGNPFDPNSPAPRGFVGISFSVTGATLRGSAVPISRLVATLQRYVPGPILDKTGLTGLFDFSIRFRQEGLVNFDGRPIGPPPVPPGVDTAAEPVPTLFNAIQELGLKLETVKAPIEVLVVDSAQKPTED